MPEPKESKAIEHSCRFYRRLLVLYPRNHRKEYGEAILQLFRDQCRDGWAEDRARGLLVCWLRALPDLLKTSFLEHLANLNRTKFMLSAFRPKLNPLSVFLPVFVCVFLFIVITATVITLIYPETYGSTARVAVERSQPASQQQNVGDAYDPYFLQTEFNVIQSHVVLSNVIEALDLKDAWGKKFNGGAPMNDTDVENMLKHSLELQPVRNTKLIEIRAYSDNPDEAARLANQVAVAFREYRLGLYQEQVRRGEPEIAKVTVTIIDPAVREDRPVRPNVSLNITIGIIAGLLLGSFTGATAAGLVACSRKPDRNPTSNPPPYSSPSQS